MAYLYELTDAYRGLLETDELTEEELITCLDNVKELFQEKAVNIGKLTLSLKAESEAINEEIKRLSDRKQAVENRVKGLKVYLEQEMAQIGIDKIKDVILTITLQNSPPSVSVIDEGLIPVNYWRIIPETKEIDKKAILSAFKENGENIPGIEIITERKHIVIR